MAAARADSRIVDGVELCLYPSDETIQFYGVIDPEQIAWMKARLTPHPWRCFEQPIGLTNEDALGESPRRTSVQRSSSTLATWITCDRCRTRECGTSTPATT